MNLSSAFVALEEAIASDSTWLPKLSIPTRHLRVGSNKNLIEINNNDQTITHIDLITLLNYPSQHINPILSSLKHEHNFPDGAIFQLDTKFKGNSLQTRQDIIKYFNEYSKLDGTVFIIKASNKSRSTRCVSLCIKSLPFSVFQLLISHSIFM